MRSVSGMRNDYYERRRSYRVATPRAKATCATRGFGDTYKLADLSLGGARLRDGRVIAPGTRVHLTLFTCSFGCMAVEGVIVRLGGDSELGVAFDDLDAVQEEALDDLLTDMVIWDMTGGRRQQA
jgi:hypothetical protein